MAIIVDPPSGWMYGFPKAVPDAVWKDEKKFDRWIVEQGYPEHEWGWAKKHIRVWST